MKTKILSMLAMAAMLLTTSCAKDEANEPASGEQVTASFNVQLPTGINARQAKGPKKAYADGKTATTLKYIVFDASGKRVAGVGGETKINLTTTVQLQLTSGKEYKIVFWAANANAPYSLDETGKVTINYDGMKANDESLDAFYRCYTYKAGDAVTENPIKLYRPFAQLNVGTKDLAQAEKTGFNKAAAKTKVKVSGIGNELNLLTGAVSGDATVTCDLNAIPTGETFPKEGYDYLSMDYLLVGKESKTNVDVDWEVTDGANTIDHTFANVPLQGNYRTNIYGSLLTSTSDFNVEIDPAFNEPANEEEFHYYTVSSYDELQNIMNADKYEKYVVYVKGKIILPDPATKFGGSKTKNIILKGVDDKSELDFTSPIMVRLEMKNTDGLLSLRDLKVNYVGKKSENFAHIWQWYDIQFWNTSVEMENVSFNQAVALNPHDAIKNSIDFNVTLKNCTIVDNDAKDASMPALWIAANSNVILDNCKITGNSAVMVSDEYVEGPTAVTLKCNNCKFTSNQRAAIYIDNEAGGTFTFTGNNDITGVKADTENHVWIDSKKYETAKDKIKVVGAKYVVKSE